MVFRKTFLNYIMPITTADGLTKYFPFLITFAPLLLFFQQIKGFLIKIFRIFWKKQQIPYDFSYLLYEELSKNYLKFRFDSYDIKSIAYFSKKYNKQLDVLLKMYKSELILYKNFIPVFISGKSNGIIKIQYLKFTLDFEGIMAKIVNNSYTKNKQNQETYSRFYVEVIRGVSLKNKLSTVNDSYNQSLAPKGSATTGSNGESEESAIFEPYRIIANKLKGMTIGSDVNDLAFDNPNKLINKYIFTEQGERVLSQVEKWLKAENWYEQKNIRWYRGCALIGKPGLGKSALILEIAKKLGIPIFVFDLNTLDNQEFEKKLDELTKQSGIILFEDLDTIWDGRKNDTRTEQYGGLDFNCFINKLSGVNAIKNKFVFITTNHLEKLDTALIRDGRIDEIIEIKSLNEKERFRMASIILENNKELIDKAMKNSRELTTAEFENICVEMALLNFWNN